MTINIIKKNNIIKFNDLENGELFVQVAYDNPYNKTFLIKIADQAKHGVSCNALEFDTDDQSSKGRLVKISPFNPIFPVKFTNVDLTLL